MKERKAGGDIRKMVAMDGHEGPKEINVGPEFFDWLNRSSTQRRRRAVRLRLLRRQPDDVAEDNQRPLTVTAMTQRIKPAIYPRVDDEATILSSTEAQGIIQASWNWPFGRKDLEVYAPRVCDRHRQRGLRVRLPKERERSERAGAAHAHRTRRARLLRVHCPRHDDAVGAVVAREQPDRHRDPRRRARVGAHGQGYPAGR